MYGLKQSPRQWYKGFDSSSVSTSFTRSQFHNCLYFRDSLSDKVVFLLLYIDDTLIAGPNIYFIEKS